MSKDEAPHRVGAWLSADENEVRLLGYGVYVGDEIPPRPMGFNAAVTGGAATWEEFDAAMVADFVRDGVPEEKAREMVAGGGFLKRNPKIVLDSGKVVWGCECWWGPEEKMRAAIGGRRIVAVDIDTARAAAAGTAPTKDGAR